MWRRSVTGVMTIPGEVYKVGGAVRDGLLGLAVTDTDWVLVGASPESLLAAGFKPVGQDFPVFLHPQTQDEYALARTERKIGRGHTGFSCYAAPDVTLEADLARRDLTINAMAEAASGQLIDPYGGLADLKAGILRHVSPAFVEDPLRVLRVARFAARFHRQGFVIAPETHELMAQMARAGDLASLPPERIWAECARALAGESPWIFVDVLQSVGALAVLMPELSALFGVPQPIAHHPEGDTGLHSLLSLKRASELTASASVRFAALVHDLGKGETDPAKWPSHHGHETAGLPCIKALCRRLKTPRDFEQLALAVAEYHTHAHQAEILRPATLLKLLKALGVFRQGGILEPFLLACQADAQGRTGLESRPYPQAERVRQAAAAARGVTVAQLPANLLTGPAIGEALDKARIAAIAALR